MAAPKAVAVVAPDEELDFELVTNISQLGTPRKLRKEMVTVPGWPTKSGKPARFWIWELSQSYYRKYIKSGRVYNKDGTYKYDDTDDDIRLLSFTMCDQHGNRLFSSVDVAKSHLDQLGRADLNILLNATSRVNSNADSEGNYDRTPSDS